MTASRMTRLCLLASAAVFALSGCGALSPGTAADVGSDKITHDEVDELATALCSANVASATAQGQAAPELPTRGTREGALQILLDISSAQQLGELRGAEPDRQQLSQVLAQNEQGVSLLPEDQRAVFNTVLEEYAESQLMLVDLGRRSLEKSGRTDVSDDQALAEGQRLRTRFLGGLDVEVDPRYGSFANGTVRPGSASLSVPASDDALAGAQAEPPPAFVSSLPASQKCS